MIWIEMGGIQSHLRWNQEVELIFARFKVAVLEACTVDLQAWNENC